MFEHSFYFELQYFGLKPEQAPVIIIMDNDDQKYVKDHVEPDAIAAYLKDYKVMHPPLFPGCIWKKKFINCEQYSALKGRFSI